MKIIVCEKYQLRKKCLMHIRYKGAICKTSKELLKKKCPVKKWLKVRNRPVTQKELYVIKMPMKKFTSSQRYAK